MNQIAITYEKDTKKVLSIIRFENVVVGADIIKIPSVITVITMNVKDLFYMKDNTLYVNESLITR